MNENTLKQFASLTEWEKAVFKEMQTHKERFGYTDEELMTELMENRGEIQAMKDSLYCPLTARGAAMAILEII